MLLDEDLDGLLVILCEQGQVCLQGGHAIPAPLRVDDCQQAIHVGIVQGCADHVIPLDVLDLHRESTHLTKQWPQCEVGCPVAPHTRMISQACCTVRRIHQGWAASDVVL